MADIDSKFTIHGSYKTKQQGFSERKHSFEYSLSWRELFALISPYLVEHPSDSGVKLKIASSIKEMTTTATSGYSATINDQEFKTITIQLKAYGLVNTKYTKTNKGGMALFWSLTKSGEQLMVESRVVREGA